MPAYRSQAEADIREPVIARLRELMPGARIINEIQNATHGPNRIDVLAVTRDRIAAVEIKSAKDKLDRLPAQIDAMRGCAHHVVAALHAKFFEVENWRDGLWAVPDWKATGGAVAWGFGFPAPLHADCIAGRHLLRERWEKPMICPPEGAINMLWREELRQIVARRALARATSKLTMPELIDVLRWHLTGAEVTREVCAALRSRNCPEADAPVEDMA